jgi:hypothetical protein
MMVMLLFAAILYPAPAFPADPLICTVDMGDINFGDIVLGDIWTITFRVTGEVQCNRNPLYNSAVTVGISSGKYGTNMNRYMKNDKTDYKLSYFLGRDEITPIDINPPNQIVIPREAFQNGRSTFEIYCKLDLSGGWWCSECEAGYYSDEVIVRLVYYDET